MLVNITPRAWDDYSIEGRARVIAFISRKLSCLTLRVTGDKLYLDLATQRDGVDWRAEIERLKEYPPEPCPCGCGVDLVMADCARSFDYFTDSERAAVLAGILHEAGGGGPLGWYITAIKQYRDRTGISLYESKRKVDALVAMLKEGISGKYRSGLSDAEQKEIQSLLFPGVTDSQVYAALVRQALKVGHREGIARGFALVFDWYDFAKAGGCQT